MALPLPRWGAQNGLSFWGADAAPSDRQGQPMKFTTKNRAGLVSGVVAAVLLSCAGPCFAQNVADAAKLERERKQHSAHRSNHVYNNDDLKRKHILIPEDQERVLEARRNSASPAYDANNNSATPDSTSSADGGVPAQPTINGAPAISLLPFSLPQAQAFGEFAPAISSPYFAAKNFRTPAAPRVRRAHPMLDDALIIDLQKNQSLPAAPEFPAGPEPTPTPSDATHFAPPAHATIAGHATIPLHATAPLAAATSTVRVQRGDSLWKLAEKHLGDGARWHELAQLNPEISDPNVIHAGDSIRLAAQAQESQSAKRFIVRPGDTLSSLAQAEFGNARAFPCIASANPNLRTADLIFPGQALVLPDTCPIVR
jgi:nucleoid-associated protein YgaU